MNDDPSSQSTETRKANDEFHTFDQYNHQVFTGPPEQTRDFVMHAAKALMKGDWKTCATMVTSMVCSILW